MRSCLDSHFSLRIFFLVKKKKSASQMLGHHDLAQLSIAEPSCPRSTAHYYFNLKTKQWLNFFFLIQEVPHTKCIHSNSN